MGLLHRDCAHWSHHQSVSSCWRHFTCSTIKLFQSFALHLQFHLGILFEDFRVALAKHLRYPVLRQNSNPHRKSGDSLARQLEEKTGMGPTGREILSCGECPHELRIYTYIKDGGTSLFGRLYIGAD